MAISGTVASNTGGPGQFTQLFCMTWCVSAVMDLTSVASGGDELETITVPGVAIGDAVTCIGIGVSVAGLKISGYVSAADTVTISAANNTGGAVDLASTTIKFVVLRHSF